MWGVGKRETGHGRVDYPVPGVGGLYQWTTQTLPGVRGGKPIVQAWTHMHSWQRADSSCWLIFRNAGLCQSMDLDEASGNTRAI